MIEDRVSLKSIVETEARTARAGSSGWITARGADLVRKGVGPAWSI